MNTFDGMLWLIFAPLALAAVVIVGAFVAQFRDLGPRHAARPARSPIGGPGMPIPMWSRYERPPPVLVALRAVDAQTVEIPAWSAETEPLWEYQTGEWPAVMEAIGQ